jgi:cobalt-zinc-cadmium efflux system outer membrane protein
VRGRIGQQIRWSQADPADKKVDDAITKLLSQPLSLDAAVQIALLRNPEIQATYEELSLAQADFVQAGLLSNPVFSASMTTAERSALSPNLILGVTESFLDAALIPAKRKVAAAELDATKFRVANAVLDLATNVGRAYVNAVAAEQTLRLERTIAEAEHASLELSERQRDAGNVSALTSASERVLFDQAALNAHRAEADSTVTREALTRLMGLRGKDIRWLSPAELPAVPAEDASIEGLEGRAVQARLDLAALRTEMQMLAYAQNLAETSRWTGLVDIGADVARLKNGAIVVGPRASIELPIFDQRRATIARLEAQARATRDLFAARVIDVESEVRTAASRMRYARETIAHYRTDVIPHREDVVRLTEQEYDAMLGGVYQLISAKQSEMTSYREYIEAVRDYWLARTDLEHAIGARLSPSPRMTAPAPVPPNKTDPRAK